MKLKKLEINGFKSFADKTEIVFGQGITGIVGPNGSGKSNIGDAVRWVLGEQSPKTLRGARMEDVIFGGTQKRKRASYCEVSLTFDNEDGSLKSSFAEVCVTRRVYRDGDSEYQLNHVNCRLRDIQDLFRDTGIGREGYSLIGQGRIDEILSQKSEDRRQVFEEAAGIMTFRVRKEEAERKLSRTAENLSRVYDIIDEIEKHLSRLEAEAETAKEYRVLFDRMRFLEANLFLVRSDRLNERIAQLTKSLEELRDSALTDEARLAGLNDQRLELDAAVSAMEEEVSAARLTYSAQLQETHDAEMNAQRMRGQLEQYMHDREQTEGSIRQLESEQTEITGQLARGDSERVRLADEVAGATEACAATLNEAGAAQDAAQLAEEELNRHKAEILSAVRQQMDVREAQSRQTAIREQMLSRIGELDQSIAGMREQYRLLLEQTERNREESEQSDRQLQEQKKALNDHLASMQSLSVRIQTATALAQKRHLSLQADASRLKLLEEMSRDMAGYQQAVKKALEYARNRSGVYGVLARLINVPEQYETAIDMALGGALQNIVTDTEDTAKFLIDYLRANRLGRATFLPISSIRSRVLTQEERRLLSMPGCLGVASELIRYDSRFKGIMENLLGRTVIADTLDHGIPIMRAGHHAFRLVTLNGDVMHSGGSMTGGTTQNRTISLLGREREIKDLRDHVNAEKEALDRFNTELIQQNQTYEALKRDEASLRQALQETEIEAARLRQRDQSDSEDQEQFRDRLQQAENARNQLQATVEEIDADLKQAAEISQPDTERNAELEQRTGELQARLVALREEAERLRDQATQAQLRLNSLTHEQETAARQIRTAETRKQENESRLAAARSHCELLRRQIDETSDKCAQAEQQVEALRVKHQGSLEIVDALEKERSAKLQEQRQLHTDLEEAHKHADETQSRIHRSELSLNKAQNDLTQMTDHLLNAYDLSYSDALQYRSDTPLEMGKADQEVAQLRARIREMGSVNTAAVEAYEAELARYRELTAQRDDLLKARSDLESLIKRLTSQMETIFTAEFAKLGSYFQETFVRLFGGGQAELRLTEDEDPLNCGIEIIAQPPGKKLQLLSLLSGGERALTAIAILFAMLKLKPTPFCILDEIEAALDDSNISNFADYLSEYARTTQFVVVTHRKGTMESCDTLYGVAMEEKGISRMVSVNLADYPQE